MLIIIAYSNVKTCKMNLIFKIIERSNILKFLFLK